jgi:hypothetical protein
MERVGEHEEAVFKFQKSELTATDTTAKTIAFGLCRKPKVAARDEPN